MRGREEEQGMRGKRGREEGQGMRGKEGKGKRRRDERKRIRGVRRGKAGMERRREKEGVVERLKKTYKTSEGSD